MVRPITLLHLSDLRFGYGHPCGRVAPPSVDDTVQAAAMLLLADVGRIHDENSRRIRPDVLLLTGDLTHEGRPSEFRDLFTFVDYLAQGLELARDRVVVVPGNRDVSREACAAYFSSCTAEESEPRPPYWPKWRFFLRFFKDLYGEHPAISFTESEPWTLWEMEDLKLTVAGLNSTFAESHREEDRYGFLGERQLEWFGRELEDARQREWLRIAVVRQEVRRSPQAVAGLAFTPGALLYAGAQDGTIRLWDPAEGRELQSIQGPADRIWSVAVSRRGDTLAVASAEGPVQLWDLKSRDGHGEARQIGGPGGPSAPPSRRTAPRSPPPRPTRASTSGTWRAGRRPTGSRGTRTRSGASPSARTAACWRAARPTTRSGSGTWRAATARPASASSPKAGSPSAPTAATASAASPPAASGTPSGSAGSRRVSWTGCGWSERLYVWMSAG